MKSQSIAAKQVQDFLTYVKQQLDAKGLTLNPVVPEDPIQQFENDHNIQLPDEYRWFMMTCGNGGAGPGHGIAPLLRSLDAFMPDRMGRFYEPSKAFPHSTYLRCLVHTDEPPNSEVDGTDFDDDFIDMLDMHLNQRSGRLGVADLPYTNADLFHHVLVPNGPRRGKVWRQRMSCGPVLPKNAVTGRSCGFLRWYLDWLNNDTKWQEQFA